MLWVEWMHGNIKAILIVLLLLITGLTIFYYKLRKAD